MEINNKIIFDRSYIGQKITCMKHGKGVIIDYRENDFYYPLICEFITEKNQFCEVHFSKEGYFMNNIKIRFLYLGHDVEHSVVESFRDCNSINELDKVIELNEPGRI